MKVAIYLRKSRADEQDESIDDTLHRHRETLLALARERGDSVSAFYEEVVSGDSLYSRPEMLRLLEDVSAGSYDAVLCMDIDRLGRGGMSDQGIILDTFKNSETKIITLRKVYDLNNELDEEYTEFETFMARRELKLIKRRMQRGIRKTVDEGGYLANAPYGYRKTVIDKRPSLEIVPEEAEIVRLIFDMYINQGAGTPTIAETLNAMGAAPRRGTEFSRSTVRFILRNPVYTGKVIWNRKQHIRKGRGGSEKNRTIYNPPEKWIVTDGKHPPLISSELFEKAQKILDSNPSVARYEGKCQNPLAGLVYCSNCGQRMQRQYRASVNKPPTLLCTRKGCIVSSPLEYVVLATLESIRKQVTKVKYAYEHDGGQPDADGLQKVADRLEKELAQYQRQKRKLFDLLEREVYDTATFLERSALLGKKISDAEARLAECLEKLDKISKVHVGDAIQKIEKVLEQFPNKPPAVQNALLKTIVSRIDYYKEKPWDPHGFVLTVSLSDFPQERE